MYTVKVEARADILGNVVDRLKFTGINANNKKEAMRLCEMRAHQTHCLKYGIPVHFVATSAKLN